MHRALHFQNQCEQHQVANEADNQQCPHSISGGFKDGVAWLVIKVDALCIVDTNKIDETSVSSVYDSNKNELCRKELDNEHRKRQALDGSPGVCAIVGALMGTNV